MRNNHEIDYHIHGEEMQYVEIELDPQETAIAEAGSLMMMDDGIQMETVFGDGSMPNQSLMGKLFSAGKRMLTGESLFMTTYTTVSYTHLDVYKRQAYNKIRSSMVWKCILPNCVFLKKM